MKRWILILGLLLGSCVTQATPTEEASLPTETLAAMETSAGSPQPAATKLPQQSATAQPGPITLITLGDSLTQGDGDDTGLGYPGRLLKKVNIIRPDTTLLNLGQSGWSSDALIAGDLGLESQLTQAISEAEAATAAGRYPVALLWIGSNDLWYLYEYGDGSVESERNDLNRFAANLDAIIGRLKDAGAEVIVAKLDDQSKRPVAIKGEAFVSIPPEELNKMSAQVVQYNLIIEEKAAQYNAMTVDFYSTDIFTNPATLYDDGNHPNHVGYNLIAQIWFEALKKLL